MRFQDLTQNLNEILEFLKAEKLLDDAQIKAMKQNAEFPKEVHRLLRELQTFEKLQLLEYTWTILPTENIRLLIITDRAQKEFRFDE
jgi:hypothetical protein